ncbi:hypothetical protein RUM44_006521 [Polyplax serrata]|uniref:Uncharacterized protein n=1 Tax=Polyplax serrata TaxID=468196 RepID=A0ABR1AK27_POLSC
MDGGIQIGFLIHFLNVQNVFAAEVKEEKHLKRTKQPSQLDGPLEEEEENKKKKKKASFDGLKWSPHGDRKPDVFN